MSVDFTTGFPVVKINTRIPTENSGLLAKNFFSIVEMYSVGLKKLHSVI